ncbi:MAG: ribonuclease III [Planctomycetia bacterium]|nr:ribonuclease III [Planctomycetia bacterium]
MDKSLAAAQALEAEIVERLKECQAVLQYSFKNVSLLVAALTHTSRATYRLASNERLEFLGDAILGAIIVDLLYHRCEAAMEGEMTQLKSVIVSRAACTRISRDLNLEKYLFLGKGMEKRGVPPSLLANMQESIIGAIYLDGGLDAAKGYVLRVFADEVNAVIGGELGKNYKMLLQQAIQRSEHKVPRYVILEQRGPDHSKCFRVQVQVGAKRYHSAWGKSKKEAEQHAAQNALCELEGKLPVYPADD